MKLNDHINADMPFFDRDDNSEIKFCCDYVCDCGAPVYSHDKFCNQCGSAVTPKKPVVVTMKWGDVKNFIRPLIEASAALQGEQE